MSSSLSEAARAHPCGRVGRRDGGGDSGNTAVSAAYTQRAGIPLKVNSCWAAGPGHPHHRAALTFTHEHTVTIFDQLVEAFAGTSDRLVTAAEIRRTLFERYGTNPPSVLPSDYSYNRWNQGISQQKPLFVRVGAGEYRYLGADQPYTGLVFWRPKGSTADQVIGERVNGELRLFDTIAAVATPPSTKVLAETQAPSSVIPLSPEQLDRLYEEYMEVLALEVAEFGCKPTETRHLIGRIGEFYCARQTKGQLARRVNQPGFDVVAEGRRISVKTTAQRTGFVSINARTLDRVDDLVVLQYDDGAFEVLYHGPIGLAVQAARAWKDRYELDLAKARHLQLPRTLLPDPEQPGTSVAK